MEVKHVCFVKFNAFSRVFKQGLALKHVYPDIKLTLICDSILHSGDVFERTFDELVSLKHLYAWMDTNEPDVYHCADDGQLWIPHSVLRRRGNAKFVYDGNDFTGLYGHGIQVEERLILESCDGIATKFPVAALDWYRDQGVLIKAPYLEYFDYCCPEFFQGSVLMAKTMLEDKERSIIHCGATSGKVGDNNYHGDWLPLVLDQGYRIAMYTSPWDDIPTVYMPIAEKYDTFTIHRGVSQPDIQKIAKYYHYGANLHDFRKCGKPKIFEETSFSHKISTYLEAGLPVIVSDNLKWISEVVVNRLEAGFNVSFEDNLQSFRDIERSESYVDRKTRVLEARANGYNAYKQVPRLVDFYENI